MHPGAAFSVGVHFVQLPAMDRYARQSLVREIGRAGQEAIGRARVAIVGIGALGCQEAALLARAGIGTLRLIDRDFVELTNLQRQILYTEQDAAAALPKAEAARAHLQAANGDIAIEAVAEDLEPANAQRHLGDVDLVVDGSDNFEVRYLVNDFCVKTGKPWVYAAAVGATGLLMPVIPGTTPCLRCLFEEPPGAGSADTCDTVGVLGPNTSTVASLAAMEALKIAAGRLDAVRRGLLQLDLWENDLRAVAIDAPRADCPCCGKRRFPYLDPRTASVTTSLCGRDAVQVKPAASKAFDFAAVAKRLAAALPVEDNGYLLRFTADGCQISLFRDGRAIVKGTADPAAARALYARTVGS